MQQQQHEYDVVRKITERSVGKYDMERIVGMHSLACIDVVLKKRNNFVAGVNMRGIQEDWSNAILRSVVMDDDADVDYEFQKAVRKMVKRFFDMCNSILNGTPEKYDLRSQLIFYSSLSTQTRRTAVELETLLNDYTWSIRKLVNSPDDFLVHAVSTMCLANKLGFFLDSELSK